MTDLSTVLHELGDPTRLRIFFALLEGRKNVSQIVGELGLTQPQVSYHLKHLREAGLVAEEKDGRWVWYEASWATGDERLREFLDLAARWVARGASQAGPRRRGGRGARPIPAVRDGEPPEDEEGRPVVRRPKKKTDLEDFLL